jgi:hypothetical protein
MIQYLYMMMSSWAIVCDVWYLPPMYKKEGESAIDFANRVKSVIARRGGLVDLQWYVQYRLIRGFIRNKYCVRVCVCLTNKTIFIIFLSWITGMVN